MANSVKKIKKQQVDHKFRLSEYGLIVLGLGKKSKMQTKPATCGCQARSTRINPVGKKDPYREQIFILKAFYPFQTVNSGLVLQWNQTSIEQITAIPIF